MASWLCHLGMSKLFHPKKDCLGDENIETLNVFQSERSKVLMFTWCSPPKTWSEFTWYAGDRHCDPCKLSIQKNPLADPQMHHGSYWKVTDVRLMIDPIGLDLSRHDLPYNWSKLHLSCKFDVWSQFLLLSSTNSSCINQWFSQNPWFLTIQQKNNTTKNHLSVVNRNEATEKRRRWRPSGNRPGSPSDSSGACQRSAWQQKTWAKKIGNTCLQKKPF